MSPTLIVAHTTSLDSSYELKNQRQQVTMTQSDKMHNRDKTEKNDDSNPQQGNNQYATSESSGPSPMLPKDGGHKKTSLPYVKIPPTKKDNRKVFVGGLPGNDFLKRLSTNVTLEHCHMSG